MPLSNRSWCIRLPQAEITQPPLSLLSPVSPVNHSRWQKAKYILGGNDYTLRVGMMAYLVGMNEGLPKRLLDQGGGSRSCGCRCLQGETGMEAKVRAEAKWLGRGRTAKRMPSALELSNPDYARAKGVAAHRAVQKPEAPARVSRCSSLACAF